MTVLYEDAWLLAVDKPAGLLVHPVVREPGPSLIELWRGARPDAALALAHRLDRETSGVVLLAKGPRADRYVKQAFAARRVEKSYLAIVHGSPAWETIVCDVPLARARDAQLSVRRRADPEGESAVTRFVVRERLGSWTLVQCQPLTGRTHQLRAHLMHLGHPILGDKLYGRPDDVFLEHQREGATASVRAAVGFPRQALHAASITLPHPEGGGRVTIAAPLPEDMAAVLAGEAPRW